MTSFVRALAAYYRLRMRWTRLRRCMSLPPSWRVLDIGAGDSPFAPADVVCEKFPWDDRERTGRFQHDRPLVVGDIESLPFRDHAFDFVYCSHVLEHTFHPDRAIAELTRVARRGYLEVPSSYLEKTCRSNPSHLWFVRLENDTLVFSPKRRGTLDPEMDRYYAQMADKDPFYSVFHYARFYSLFNIGLYWESSIPFRIETDGTVRNDASSFDKGSSEVGGHSLDGQESRQGLAAWIKRRVRRKAEAAKTNFRVHELLACPVCRGPLVDNPNARNVACRTCRTAYPVAQGVPVLLPEASVSTPA